MKAVCFTLCLGLLTLGSPAFAEGAADPSGMWHTISDVDGKPRGQVRMRLVGDELRGEVAGALRGLDAKGRVCAKCSGARKNQPILGMTILWGLKRDPRNPSQFTGGSVLDPETGDIYAARLKLSPDGESLTLRGYLLVSMLGRSQTWRRAP